ncbi:MAG TPA: bifunctional homocysteine S-methyltransferase/methylenetetrahydrofolate reductase [Polyangiales bacterium]|nr:bifunctional homocysteine S-methyltransferase/methylenetetrahydrofolate reductase [Polyangiales bacterium]
MSERNSARPEAFRAALQAGGLVFDGAMGSLLYEKGNLYTACFEEMNLSRADVILQIHRGYAEAGAEVIETNTFGANRFRLARHGLESRTRDINLAGVKLAREAAGKAFVAGSVGPTGLTLEALSEEQIEDVAAAFREQCEALIDGGVDALILETFRQPDEIKLALEAAIIAADGKVPVIACVSFDEGGTTADGKAPEEVARLLAEWRANAIGVNCATGPAGVYEMLTRMKGPNLPLVAIPNAGLPQRVDGRLAYMATPEYFQVYARRLYKAGANAVGGCCGTTPEHIRKIAAAARMIAGGQSADPGGGMRDENAHRVEVAPGIVVVETKDKGSIGAKLGKKFVVSVEVNPPPGLSIEAALESARVLKRGGVDMINVADGARAQARMGNLALCLRIQQEVGLPALMHLTSRDRNLLGQVAHLLAAHELGVRNLVVITGDPPKMGDFPNATSVYDTDSIGLLRLISAMNRGYDPGGKALGGATQFLCATGAEPAAHDYQRELDRLKEKIDAGAELIMTQPVYDPDVLGRMLNDVSGLGVPVLVGLLPLASYKNAEFLHNEVPGMKVPEPIRERMKQAGGGETGRSEGIAIAREMLLAVKDNVAGAYIMPPFGKHEVALRVLEGIV